MIIDQISGGNGDAIFINMIEFDLLKKGGPASPISGGPQASPAVP